MSKKIKTIFMGTPDFAAPFLEALVKAPEFDVLGVVTQPDKAVGRKQIIAAPPVKILAGKYGLKVFQPEKISGWDYEAEFGQGNNPDLIVVAAYGQIIPRTALNWPKFGCINVHASLLPKYRGASPIQASILNGDKETGVTLMKMEAGLDTGPILRQNKLRIEAADTSGSLFSRLAELGLQIFIPSLIEYVSGLIKPRPQDEVMATYAPRLTKRDALIDWTKNSGEIERMIRAYNPWPGALLEIPLKRAASRLKTKIFEVLPKPVKTDKYKPGELFKHNGGLAVRCGTGGLVIKYLQPAGKKKMTAEEFLNGYGQLVKD